MSGSWVASANEIGAQMVDALWRASWQGAVGIAVVWFICRTWKRMPCSVRCAMWFLVCLKLIVALSPAGIAIRCLPYPVNLPKPVAQREYPLISGIGIKAASLPPTTIVENPRPGPEESLSIASWLAGLWMIGAALVGTYSIWRLAKSIRLIRRASPCIDPILLDQAEEVRRFLSLRSVPRLMMTSDPTAVLTFGALQPIVLMSSKTVADCSEEETRMVLAHEFAHIRRMDAWLGLIPQMAQTLFYFHPMVWLACREFDLAREASCDEEAIIRLQIRSDLYGRLLLKLGSRRQATTTLCTPGVSSHFHLLRRRIAMLDKPTDSTLRSTRRRPLALICLIGALCIAPFSLVQGQFASTASLKTPTKPTVKTAFKKAVINHGKTTTKHAAVNVAKQPLAGSKPSLHVFRLKNADPERAATVLRQVLGTGNDGRVVADAKSSSIIVSVDDTTATQIASVIKNLDEIPRVETKPQLVPKEPQQVIVYGVKNTDVGNLLNLLHTLYGKPEVAVVKVTADLRTNSIIVMSPENRTREVSALIDKLDVPETSIPEEKRTITRRVKVRYGDPKQIIPMVMAIMKTAAPQYMAQDLTTNDIIVVGNEDNINRAQMLANILDAPKAN